jgi:hypothetical protein
MLCQRAYYDAAANDLHQCRRHRHVMYHSCGPNCGDEVEIVQRL